MPPSCATPPLSSSAATVVTEDMDGVRFMVIGIVMGIVCGIFFFNRPDMRLRFPYLGNAGGQYSPQESITVGEGMNNERGRRQVKNKDTNSGTVHVV